VINLNAQTQGIQAASGLKDDRANSGAVAYALIVAVVFCVWQRGTSFENPGARLVRAASCRIPTGVQHAVSGITFHKRKMNNLNEYTYWFESSGKVPLVKPDTGRLHAMRPEDLFVHTYGGCQPQVWLRTGDKRWTRVEPDCPHPRLNNYVLQMSDIGQPRWVTKGTARKNARDRDRGRVVPVDSPQILA